jgi:hypothetical protein
VGEVQLDRKSLIQAQNGDKTLRQVRKWLKEGILSQEGLRGESEEAKMYTQLIGSIGEKDGLLLIKQRGNRWSEKVCERALIPEEMKEAMFYWTHQHQTVGHFGQRATVL